MKALISSYYSLKSFILSAPNLERGGLWVLLAGLALYLIIGPFLMSYLSPRKMEKIVLPAARIPSWIPSGLDVMITTLIHLKNDTFFPWAHNLMSRPGHTVEFNVLGMRLVMTDDVENIKTIFSTNFSTWIKGQHMRDIWSIVLGDSIFTTDGQQWLANKAQLRGHLAKARPNDLDLTEMHFQELKKHLIKKEPQHVYDLMERYQLDVVTRVFLGKSSDSLPSTHQALRIAMDRVFNVNTQRIFLGPLGKYVPMNIVAGNSLEIIDNYIRRIVDRAMSLSPADLKAIDENDRNLVESLVLDGKDAKTIKDQLLAVLTAAKDPSSMAISWAIYELNKNPDVLEKLEAEIETHVGFENMPTAAQLKEMNYLRCIMLETFRVYHSLGFNMRTAAEDTFLPRGGGPQGDQPVTVLKGTQCIYSILSLQHRTDIWGPDAGIWKPDRWVDYNPPVWDFIPFNHGPRVCLGRAFGQQQVLYGLVRIYQEFGRIEQMTTKPQRIKCELNTKMAYPCMCIFHPRKKSQRLDKEGLV